MRPILLLIASVSTLLFAQNVLAVAPDSVGPVHQVSAASPEVYFVASHSTFGEDAPRPGSMALLVAGLAGLTVAGGRKAESGPEESLA